MQGNEKPRQKADSGFQHMELLSPDTIKNVKAGDILEITYYHIPHKLVVESVSQHVDCSNSVVSITAIHYGRMKIIQRVRVIRNKYTFTAVDGRLKRECWLCHFPEPWCHPPDIVVQRARSRLNEMEHSVVDNLASHFALWCKTMSASNRPNCLVPIFMPESDEIHKLKAGDHLNFKPHMGSTLHGVIVCVTELNDQKSLVTMRVSARNIKCRSIGIVQVSYQWIDKSALVVRSAASGLTASELAWRIEQVKSMIYRVRTTSFAFCLHLINPDLGREDWRQISGDVPPCNETEALCTKAQPVELRPGDIIFNNGIYRVVAAVRQDESKIIVTTVHYSTNCIKDSPIPFDARTAINRKDREAFLCVHNNPEVDCELNGGGRDKPNYTADHVTDIRQIRMGSIISVKKSILYTHMVVMSDPDPVGPVTSNGANTGFLVDVASYSMGLEVITSRNKIFRRSITIDINKQSVYLIKYDIAESRLYSAKEVVARAESRLGQMQHHLQRNNHQDFARWCCINHPSNREQCCVPIESAQQLIKFKRGHIKFLKSPKWLYSHDAIMRECTIVCSDIVKVRIYENNHVDKKVRFEVLRFGEDEVISRIKYVGNRPTELRILDDLEGHTFLNADDNSKAWTGKVFKCGSRVRSQDFCYWLMTRVKNNTLSDIRELFGSELSKIQSKLEQLEKPEISKAETSTLSIERVTTEELERFDHIILFRTIDGRDTKVHFVLTEWNSNSRTGVGVTYELPAAEPKMGFKEFSGFLRVTGPGQLEKVVHNSDLNWNAIDVKFNECRGGQEYSLLFNNCEHFVNFLIYGRITCLQLSNHAERLINYFPQTVHCAISYVFRVSRIILAAVSHVSNPATSGADGSAMVGMLIGSILYVWLRKRRADTAMPNHEYRERLLSICSSAISAVLGTALVLCLSKFTAASCGAPLAGIGLVGIVFLLLKLRVLARALWIP